MIWQVMLYAVGVAAALSVMGYCQERLAFMRDMPQRWVWPLTMVLSICWAVGGILWVGPAVRAAPDLPGVASVPPSTAAGAPAVMVDAAAGTKSMTVDAAAVLLEPVANRAQAALRWSAPSDRTLLLAWGAASALLLLYFAVAGALLHRRALYWKRTTVLDREVLVSESTGPALLGNWRPQIVVPQWFMQESPARQALILQHEEQHRAARDPLLLRAAQIIVIALPWNLPLWWQLRRLRQAIEMDCDARVLRRGTAPAAYGEVLLSVARRTEYSPTGMVAMGAPVSSLERRIRNLTPDPARHSVVRATLAILVWMVGIGAAGALEAPALPERSAAATQQLLLMPPVVVTDARALAAGAATVTVAPDATRAATNLPRLLPPKRAPQGPSRREIIERALVDRHPELVNGPVRDGHAFVSMRLGPDREVVASEVRFVEQGDIAGLEAANAAASAAYLRPSSGTLLLASGWQIAGGATVKSQVRVSYSSPAQVSDPASGPRIGRYPSDEAFQVVEHHLPGALSSRGRADRNPYLVLSQDGRVLRSGYLSAPANLKELQAVIPGWRLTGLSIMPPRSGASPSGSTLLFAWVEQ